VTSQSILKQTSRLSKSPESQQTEAAKQVDDYLPALEYNLQKRVNEKGQSIVYEDFKARMLKEKVAQDKQLSEQKEIQKLFTEP
jgi:hypothetical protein